MTNSDQINGLWRYYEEQAAQARQHESLRATVTSILSGIAAAMIALAGQGGLGDSDIPTAVVVMLMSGLGTALSLKHYERNRFHTMIMGKTRDQIDNLIFKGSEFPTLSALRRAGRRANEEEHPRLSKIRLHVLWLGLPVGIGIIGLLLVVLSAIGVHSTD